MIRQRYLPFHFLSLLFSTMLQWLYMYHFVCFIRQSENILVRMTFFHHTYWLKTALRWNAFRILSKEITKYLFNHVNVNIYSLVRSRGAYTFYQDNKSKLQKKWKVVYRNHASRLCRCGCILRSYTFTFIPYNILNIQKEKVSGRLYRLFMVVGKWI